MISSPQATACIDSGCVGHTGILRVREELACQYLLGPSRLERHWALVCVQVYGLCLRLAAWPLVWALHCLCVHLAIPCTCLCTQDCLLPRACILQENAFWFLLLLVSGDLGRFQSLTFQIVRGLSLMVDKGGGCGMGPLKPLWILTNSLQKGTFDFRLLSLECSSMGGN